MPNESPSDGIESTEMVLVDNAEPILQSLMLRSSSNASSGGDSSISIVSFPNDQLSSFSETCCSSMISVAVISLSFLLFLRLELPRCRGMLVTASKAATEGEISSDEETLGFL